MPVVLGLVIALAALAIYEKSKPATPPPGLRPASPTPPNGLTQSTAGELKDIFGAASAGIDSLSKLKGLLGLGSSDPTTVAPDGAATFSNTVNSSGDSWIGDGNNADFQLKMDNLYNP